MSGDKSFWISILKGTIQGSFIFLTVVVVLAILAVNDTRHKAVSNFKPNAVAYTCREMPPSTEDTLAKFYKCEFTLVIETGDHECRLKKI